MSTPEHLLPPPPACPCVVFVGMAIAAFQQLTGINGVFFYSNSLFAAVGFTESMALAQTLGWAFMDSDYLMEALYADRLQSVTDALSKEAFLDLEAVVLGSIRVQRTVIATGGKTGDSILETIEAGANAISWTPPAAPWSSWTYRWRPSKSASPAIPTAAWPSPRGRPWPTFFMSARPSTPTTPPCAVTPARRRPSSVPAGSPSICLPCPACPRPDPLCRFSRPSPHDGPPPFRAEAFFMPFSHDRDGALRPGLPPTSATG